MTVNEGFDSDHFFIKEMQTINKMVEIVNEETEKYNQMQSLSKEKLMLASDINSANIQILNHKSELILSCIKDIYEQLHVMTTLIDSSMKGN
jgi:hypothetical protein